jgi:hypothetical protein
VPLDLREASERRQERAFDAEMESRLELLLANYQRVTANPRSMGYLRFLLKHYAKKAHPWRECYKDNFKRFGPKTAALCGVLKDTIRQQTHWRGHPGLDHGAPGVAIGEADKGAAPPFGGRHHMSEQPCCLLDELNAEFGPRDHRAELQAALELFAEIGERCDPYRVLIGLDEPPQPPEVAG